MSTSRRTTGVATIVLGVTIAVAIGLASCDGDDDSDDFEVVNLAASLDGASVVPPVDTSGSGDADFIANRGVNTIAFDFRTDNLQNITAVHIHFGRRGENGPVLFTLSDDDSSDDAGTLGSDDLTPDSDAGINDIDDAINAMEDGNTYIDVHTEAHPDGEIRGQIQER